MGGHVGNSGKLVPEEKQWALGFLDQESFAQEFQRRNPRADTIPDRKKWMWAHDPAYNGIDEVPEDAYEVDSADSRMKKRKNPDDDLRCMGCGTRFSVRIARISHERSCPDILQMRGENG